MKERWKIIIPVGILIFPLSIFLFFKLGTKQFYNPLPTYGEKSVSPGGTDSLLYKIPDFNFTDQNGTPFGKKDLMGKITVLNVLSTSKPDAATLMTKAMNIVNSYYEETEDIEVLCVSLTADPDRDTPEILKNFAAGLEATSPRWHFLTGNKAELLEFADKGLWFECTAENKPFSEDYTFRLIDKEGKVRGTGYDGLNQKDMDKIIDDIKALKWEYNNPPS